MIVLKKHHILTSLIIITSFISIIQSQITDMIITDSKIKVYMQSRYLHDEH